MPTLIYSGSILHVPTGRYEVLKNRVPTFKFRDQTEDMITRFFSTSSLTVLILATCFCLIIALPHGAQADLARDIASFDCPRVLAAAQKYLKEEPITITASRSPRSAGGPHDFFSEGDYWWPDPENPNGPYIQRDGMTNPDNFTQHRRHLMRMSVQVPALVAAWKLTGDRRYARHAAKHLNSWFVDKRTRMNPSLLYAQAIHGRVTGRGIGIIDTIHLVEVARAIEVLEAGRALPESKAIKQWFRDYLHWLTTHQYGIDEREAKNNHGTCWVMQVAQFAKLTGNEALLAYTRNRFKTVLLPNQMAADGSFPQEMRRTKPYGYALFNLEAMATVAIYSQPKRTISGRLRSTTDAACAARWSLCCRS